MSHRAVLAAIALGLAVGASGSTAQPAEDAPRDDTAAKAGEAPVAEAGAGSQGQAEAQRSDSPFDYRPSEEISEDLPVSFPVDI